MIRRRVHVGDIAPGDEEALAELHSAAFSRNWSADEFAALLAERSVFGVAVYRFRLFGRRRIAGFVLVRMAADEAEILTVVVRRKDRGKGYGRLLMEEALRRLYRERIKECFLEVDRGNTTAVNLYRSLGFAIAGQRKDYYRRTAASDGTALVMRAQLR